MRGRAKFGRRSAYENVVPETRLVRLRRMGVMTSKKTLAVCGLLALGAIPSFADVSGSPLLDYGNLDNCPGCIFPVIGFTAANAGHSITSFSFYAGTANPDVASFNASVTSNSLRSEEHTSELQS